METKHRKYLGLYAPAFLSFILMAAHISRNGMDIIALLWLGIPFLLLVYRKWNLWFCIFALLLGTGEWIRSAMGYIAVRSEMGEDWTRLAIILFSVAGFTLLSALVLLISPIRKKYI